MSDIAPHKFWMVLRNTTMAQVHSCLHANGFEVEGGDGVMIVTKPQPSPEVKCTACIHPSDSDCTHACHKPSQPERCGRGSNDE